MRKCNDSSNVALLLRHKNKQYKDGCLGDEPNGTDFYLWPVVPIVDSVK